MNTKWSGGATASALFIFQSFFQASNGTIFEDGERRGVGIRISYQLNDSATETMEHYFLEGDAWGSSACFDHKTPKELLAQKHLYFPDDDEATLTVTGTLFNN